MEQLTKIMREYKGDATLVLKKDMQLIADLELDSFDLVSLVCQIEEEFKIEIPDREMKKIKTVGDVLDLLER